MKKWIHCLVIVTLVLSFVLEGIVIYWLVYPYKITELKSPVTTENLVYRPGERLVYTLDYCKNAQMQGDVYRSLVNSIKIDFTPVKTDLSVGCKKTKIADLVIPDFVDEGIYKIETVIHYKVNPLRTITTTWVSNSFEIIK